MPWKESSVLDERLRFVARLLEGEQMSHLCREFGISRKTGYKIFERYKIAGVEALTDRSRRPVRYANQLPAQVESAIIGLKREKPHSGARKIRELLVRRLAGDVRIPARSTIHAVLDRHGLVNGHGSRTASGDRNCIVSSATPNDLWCADYKGEFRLGNKIYCYPLTVTDHASRYLLLCEALSPRAKNWLSWPLNGCSRAWSAQSHTFRQRCALRLRKFPLQSLQAFRLVAPARHRDRAHQTRTAPAERPARAHASDAQERSHPSARHELLQQQARSTRSSRSSTPSGPMKRSP